MPSADLLSVLAVISNGIEGRHQAFRPFSLPVFYVSSQAVNARLACLIVVPDLPIFSVTPPPE